MFYSRVLPAFTLTGPAILPTASSVLGGVSELSARQEEQSPAVGHDSECSKEKGAKRLALNGPSLRNLMFFH